MRRTFIKSKYTWKAKKKEEEEGRRRSKRRIVQESIHTQRDKSLGGMLEAARNRGVFFFASGDERWDPIALQVKIERHIRFYR